MIHNDIGCLAQPTGIVAKILNLYGCEVFRASGRWFAQRLEQPRRYQDGNIIFTEAEQPRRFTDAKPSRQIAQRQEFFSFLIHTSPFG